MLETPRKRPSLPGEKTKVDLDALVWRTPEGIDIKPLCTAKDLEGITHLESLPGEMPFVRGPQTATVTGPA